MTRSERLASADSGAAAWVGARRSQQDHLLTASVDGASATLAVVADGMGGHAEGALASRIAATTFQDSFLKSRAGGQDLRACFERGLAAANAALSTAQHGYPEREGMGTTLLAAYVSRAGVAWVSVGDSLLLLFNGGTLRRLNEDHSLRGVPGAEKRGNMLRSAVTGATIPLVDCQPEPLRLEAGDRLALASDGVLTLSMDRLATLLQATRSITAQATAERALAAVKAAAGPRQDNCTIVVVDPPGAAATFARPGHVSPLLIPMLAFAMCAVMAFALLW